MIQRMVERLNEFRRTRDYTYVEFRIGIEIPA